MSTTVKRPQQIITKGMVVAACKLLDEAPDPPLQLQPITRRDAVGQMRNSIAAALKRGFTKEAIVGMLNQEGFGLTVASVTNYARASNQAKRPIKRNRNKPLGQNVT